MLYVRYLGWLHTFPNDKAKKSRGASMGVVRYPPLGDSQYLIDVLVDVGIPVDWDKLRAWSSMTQCRLTPWEARAVVTLSRSYQAAVQEFNGKPAKSPWTGLENIDRNAVAAQARRAFRG